MSECKTYKLGSDYFMDCRLKTREAPKASKQKAAGAAPKDAFTQQPPPKAPKLPWFGKPAFF